MEACIKTSNLEFGNFITYPDILIPRHQVTFLCGASGCGKSSLLKLLNATVTPSKGDIFYQDRNIKEMDTITLRKEILLVSQAVYLFDESIEENFKRFYDYRDEAVISSVKMQEYLRICCVDFSLNTRCETMSGGEKQRVFMAIYLSFLPKVLMLDEPTSALDQATATVFLQNIKNFCREHQMTAVVISHDEKLTKLFADHVITLERR